jgi:hypothetical protein
MALPHELGLLRVASRPMPAAETPVNCAAGMGVNVEAKVSGAAVALVARAASLWV